MYELPITIEIREISRKYVEEIDNLVLNEIRKYDVQVDKDELIKAMKYDRDQYDKGFADGKKETAQEILQEIAGKLKDKMAYSFIFGKSFLVENDIDETLKEFAKKYGIEKE